MVAGFPIRPIHRIELGPRAAALVEITAGFSSGFGISMPSWFWIGHRSWLPRTARLRLP